jgi:hypothetical protein
VLSGVWQAQQHGEALAGGRARYLKQGLLGCVDRRLAVRTDHTKVTCTTTKRQKEARYHHEQNVVFNVTFAATDQQLARVRKILAGSKP